MPSEASARRRACLHLAQSYGWQAILGSVAQLAEQPVVCGKAEGANPFGSAILSERSSVFRALVAVRQHLGTGRSQEEILPFRPCSICCRGRIHQASAF